MIKSVIKKIIDIRNGLRRIYAQYFGVYNDSAFGKKGRYSIVANNSTLNPKNIYIDDYCVIQSQINFISNNGKLIIKKYSVISSGCTIVPEAHKLMVGVPFYMSTIYHINDNEGDILIDEDCWIGAGCILLPKCHIGRGAVVGAGSVVKKDVPPYAVVVGTPARIIATKFTLDEVIRHEAILYPPEERMTKMELENLYRERFGGLRSIGEVNLPIEEQKKVEEIRNKIGMINYSI